MLASSVLAVGVKVPVQVTLSLLLIVASVPVATVMSAALAKEATASEKTSVTVAVSPALSAVSERVKEFGVGAVESKMNVDIVRVLLTFPVESVTVIVQFEYVPSASVSKVIVLSSAQAVFSSLLQLPP